MFLLLSRDGPTSMPTPMSLSTVLTIPCCVYGVVVFAVVVVVVVVLTIAF